MNTSICKQNASWATCICNRKSTRVSCTNQQCFFVSHGRVRRLCPQHQKVMFLMDLVGCPECGARCEEVETVEGGNQEGQSQSPGVGRIQVGNGQMDKTQAVQVARIREKFRNKLQATMR